MAAEARRSEVGDGDGDEVTAERVLAGGEGAVAGVAEDVQAGRGVGPAVLLRAVGVDADGREVDVAVAVQVGGAQRAGEFAE